MTDGALARLGDASDTDYVLSEEHTSCWITVGNISVYVRRCDEGVSVDLFPLGVEADNSLAGTSATFAEARGRS